MKSVLGTVRPYSKLALPLNCLLFNIWGRLFATVLHYDPRDSMFVGRCDRVTTTRLIVRIAVTTHLTIISAYFITSKLNNNIFSSTLMFYFIAFSTSIWIWIYFLTWI
jgi:hypothetical protein